MIWENRIEAIPIESYVEATDKLGAGGWEVLAVSGPHAVQSTPIMQAQSLTEQSGKIIQAQAAVKPGFFVFLKRPARARWKPASDALEAENPSPAREFAAA